MNREELESRSKSELIDLAVQQQRQIAQLQAQIALQKAQDSTLLAASAPVEQGRFPLAFKVVLFVAALFACGIVVIVANWKPALSTSVGRAQDYPPGSVTAMRLPAPGAGDTIPIFLVNDPAAGFLALYNRDPHSNCPLNWNRADARFEDPCHGSRYSRAGEYLFGPATRSLDRYPIKVTESGDVTVDLSSLQSGSPRP